MSTAEHFYDALAADYDCLFEDWWTAAQWHGSVIAALLATEGVAGPATLLDCACGIGTQALPLAARGYVVTGTDVSRGALERARSEAAMRGINASLAVADMRDLPEALQGRFDAALACDNALPHLLSDGALSAALRSIRGCLRPGGLFLASVRDYDALAAAREPGVPVSMFGERGSRHASGQAWTWSDGGDFVDITLFTMTESRSGWRVGSHETRYRALKRQTLTSVLGSSGFEDIRWLSREESGYYQPIVVARATHSAV